MLAKGVLGSHWLLFLSIPFQAELNPTDIYHDYKNYKYQNNAINNFDKERN